MTQTHAAPKLIATLRIDPELGRQFREFGRQAALSSAECRRLRDALNAAFPKLASQRRQEARRLAYAHRVRRWHTRDARRRGRAQTA